MKNSILIILLVLGLITSCKKEDVKFSQFEIDFADLNDSIYYDSVAYAILNYSDFSEFKDTTALKDPDIFTHTEKIEKRSGPGISLREFGINWTAEHTYVIKKFDLVSESGNVIFYIPYGTHYYIRSGIKYLAPISLPFTIKAFDGSSSGLYFTKK